MKNYLYPHVDIGIMEFRRLGYDKIPRKRWSGLDGIQPNGWDELAKDYSDFDGMEEMGDVSAKFEGYDDATACSFGFPVKVSLPHVMYDDFCQGRDNLQVLFGALVSYGYQIGKSVHEKDDKFLSLSAETYEIADEILNQKFMKMDSEKRKKLLKELGILFS